MSVPHALQASFLGNSLMTWLLAALIAVGATLGVQLLKRLAGRYVARIARRTDTLIDDKVSALVRDTSRLFPVAVGIAAGAQALALSGKVHRIISHAVVLVLLYQIGRWASDVLVWTVERASARATQTPPVADAERPTQPPVGNATAILRLLAKVIVWAAVVLVALQNLGIDVTALIAGLGVGGVAIALAVQNVLGDLFASLSIVLDKPFEVGHFVVVGDKAGTVERVGIKTTRVRALSGEQLVFSNTDLLTSRLHNYGRMRERRVLFTVGVTYSTPADALESVPAMLREIVEAAGPVRFDRAHFKAMGDSSLVFEVVYYVLDPDYNKYMDVQQAINLAIVRRFQAEGIDFAFPSRTVYAHIDAMPELKAVMPVSGE